MFTIGAFLLLLGFIFDEGTTTILFFMGMEVLETNPLYVSFGLGGMMGILIIGYMFMLAAWRYVIKTNRTVLTKRYPYRKWYDLIVFMFCFIIVSMVSTKILIGYEHLNTIIDYNNDPVIREAIDTAVENYQTVREINPEIFEKTMIENYEENALQWSYLQVLFNAMMAFLLFKVGYKTAPWDMA